MRHRSRGARGIHTGAMTRRATLVLLLLLTATGAAVIGLRNGYFAIPEQWNPWTPLRISESPTLLTRFTLARLNDAGNLCSDVLADTDMRLDLIGDDQTGGQWRLR